MEYTTHLNVTHPVAFWKRKPQVNFKDLFTAFGKALIDAGKQNWSEFGKDLVDVTAALGLAETPGQKAFFLIKTALVRACTEIAMEGQVFEGGVSAEALANLGEQLDQQLDEFELQIDKTFFDNPRALSIVEYVRPIFAIWITEQGQSQAQAETISYRLPSYFVFQLNDEWRRNAPTYEAIYQELITPVSDAVQRELSWRSYHAYLEKETNKTIFNEPFGLRQIYIPLRAYYEETQKDESDGSKEKVKHVVALHDHLQAWVNQGNPSDALKLISGGPGAGKSSFAKMFAEDQGADRPYRTLFIPLHHFEFSSDLKTALDAYIQTHPYLTYNPLEHQERLLIIFDGLDELALQGKIAQESSKQFVDAVERQLNQFNKYDTIKLQVIISGRELAVQANINTFSSEERVLHLLPYYVSEKDQKQYQDPSKLLAEDQRNAWWKQYGKWKGLDHENMPGELDLPKLQEITAQPLLNYLVAQTHEAGNITFTQDTNLNQIYHDLIVRVYKRGYEPSQTHKAIRAYNLSEKDFQRVFEEIAVATWHGNGRTTTVSEIHKHCEGLGLEHLLKMFQAGAEEGATRLLTAFYFRRADRITEENEKTFEFTHKSFGEYLAARRIVRKLKNTHDNLEDWKKDSERGKNKKTLIREWITLFWSNNH